MGNLILIGVQPDADSPSTPGSKVCLTDEVPLSAEAVFDGFVEFLEDPAAGPWYPIWYHLIKSVELDRESDTCFVFKVIWDGEKLNINGMDDGSCSDRVKFWRKVTMDRAEGIIISEEYTDIRELDQTKGLRIEDAEVPKLTMTIHHKIHQYPVRVETFCINHVTGERMTGQVEADLVKNVLSYLIWRETKFQVQAVPDVDALGEAGAGKQSTVTEPLDDFITYDQLFDGFTNFSNEFQGARIEAISDKEVLITGPDGSTRACVYDRDTGVLIRTYRVKGRVMWKRHMVLHRDPLQMEAWSEDEDGVRVSDKWFANWLAFAVNTVITMKGGGALW